MLPEVTLAASQLSVRYTDLVALDIPTLNATGSVIAILGHNGAGKSTLIKTMLGLLEPFGGSLGILDSEGRALVPERDMAFCPESGAVFADISVERYLQLWCRIKHNEGKYYRKQGAKYVERLHVAELLRKKGRELSKGQKRRVQTALGFMSDPRVFLFDEPFDGLDVQRTNELMEIVEEECQHRAFLISSHRMDVMERLSHCVVVLAHGEVACVGGVDEVCNRLSGSVHAESIGRASLTDAMRTHLQSLSAL
jgi:ABC-type multidrug transport system ATPase subunit